LCRTVFVPSGNSGLTPRNLANEVTAETNSNCADALQLSNSPNEVTAYSERLAKSSNKVHVLRWKWNLLEMYLKLNR